MLLDIRNVCVLTVEDVNMTICDACNVHEVNGRPAAEDFMTFLPWFLQDNPGMTCTKG